MQKDIPKTPFETDGSIEERVRDLFEQHADQELLRQYFEGRPTVEIVTNEEPEYEFGAIGV